jgi:hypothetical protein
MTGAEAAEQAADRAERAEARPIVHYGDESDGEESILVPGTPPGPQGAAGLRYGRISGRYHYNSELEDP